MSRRTILSAASAGNCAFDAAIRRAPTSICATQQQAQRSFSTTSQRNVMHITHFTPTSSTDLDTLLSTIRTKIILPSYLSVYERKKLYSPRYAKELESNPIVIEIDGEVHKFRYIDVFSGEMPNTRKTVAAAIQKFETDDDFMNLRPLLEGLMGTGRKFDNKFYAKVIRQVCAKGRLPDLLECARAVKRTGLKLDSSEKVNEVLHSIQLRAIDAEWKRKQTEQALRWSETVLDLLEDELHKPTVLIKGGIHRSRDPLNLLASLHLAAALVVKTNAEEAREKVTKYANLIVRIWPETSSLKLLHQADIYEDASSRDYLLEPNKFVALASPWLHGLDLAAQAVTDPALAEQLRSRQQILAAEVAEAREAATANGKNGRGEAVYAKVFGTA